MQQSQPLSRRAMRAAGAVVYVGISTSEGRRNRKFERVTRQHPLAFIQVTNNILERKIEDGTLPLVAERSIGLTVNRSFQQGALFDRSARPRPLPRGEIDARSWAQFILKFIVSHPAVICAFPAARVEHVRENMAATGRLREVVMPARVIA